MTPKKVRNSFLLVLTALIWGVAFVAQSAGGDAVGPYSFNCIRFVIGSLVLLPVIFMLDRQKRSGRKPVTKQEKRTLWLGGISCGIVLAASSMVQQLGIYYGTSAGKAGFLTACYILIVPVLGLFLKKKCGINVWCGVLLAMVGLYLLCMKGSFQLGFSDTLVLLCALLFSFHILIVDHFSPLVDGVRMSCIQFLIAGVICAVPMFFVEMGHSLSGIQAWALTFASWDAWLPILYAGILSCGVAYTLQIVGQEGLNPTTASLLMSLESVFSVVAGWLLLGEQMSVRELTGCVILFAAIVLAQIPIKTGNRGQRTGSML